jgi:DNA polymerase-3 subunit alpha
MAEQREIFLTRAQAQQFDAKKAGELFDLMAYFAGYGFNKSHSAAYALIAYQTAYLKANFTAEFMACLISLEATHAENMAFYLQEAKDLGLKILPPNINTSAIHFAVVNNEILFGLQGIKNVGLASLENIIQERSKGPFTDLLNFCERIDLRTSNKRVIEHLICAGAFDTLPGNRAQKMAELERVMDLATEHKRALQTGQMGLFGSVNNSNETREPYLFQPLAAWSDKETLEKEQEVVGFYLSAHPLESYAEQLGWFKPLSFAQALEQAQQFNSPQEYSAICCGIIKNRRDITTKKGDRMAFVQLEDMQSTAEIILFPRTFTKVEAWLDTHQVFVVRGAVDISSPLKCKIKANDCVPLELMFQEWPSIQRLSLTLAPSITESDIEHIAKTLQPGKISVEFLFHEQGKQLRLTCNKKVALDQALLSMLKEHSVGIRVVL